jgi:hypothetical protein
MANRIKGEARFTFDGRDFAVLLNMEALLAAEDESGSDLATLIASPKLGDRALLLRHAIAQAGGADVSRAEAAEMLMDGAAAKAWGDVFAQAFPPAEAEEGKARPTTKGGTGPKS